MGPVSCEPPCSSLWLLGAQHLCRCWPGTWECCSTKPQFLRDPVSVSEGKHCKAGCSRGGLVLSPHAARWGGVFSVAVFSYQKNALNWIPWVKTSLQCIHPQALFYTTVEHHGSLLHPIWKLALFLQKAEQSYLSPRSFSPGSMYYSHEQHTQVWVSLKVTRWKPSSLNMIRYLLLTDFSRDECINVFNVLEYGMSELIVSEVLTITLDQIFLAVCTLCLLAWPPALLFWTQNALWNLTFTGFG